MRETMPVYTELWVYRVPWTPICVNMRFHIPVPEGFRTGTNTATTAHEAIWGELHQRISDLGMPRETSIARIRHPRLIPAAIQREVYDPAAHGSWRGSSSW
ncbi:MAG: hypothetical protein A3I33_02435 [Candidatus Colwellbacteria bacterium RIFCSPLOWO2_02_FULL_45_11]|uniref:Uncharacterized protein n=1 Tax=Candidatus Colwellbacteria bacterium RIFCSPLOWO2_02_FULL_45_11 TaxID=1797692 RepID=A0A1G1Z828_9BACT|nr:MAG: hypothetical protein A3I33_02435 [Candidatus Colwellbacteria bacterium RIFCSPLOWO2_02_FULL_45_11]